MMESNQLHLLTYCTLGTTLYFRILLNTSTSLHVRGKYCTFLFPCIYLTACYTLHIEILQTKRDRSIKYNEVLIWIRRSNSYNIKCCLTISNYIPGIVYFWKLKYVLLIILLYFYLSKSFNAKLLLVAGYFLHCDISA